MDQVAELVRTAARDEVLAVTGDTEEVIVRRVMRDLRGQEAGWETASRFAADSLYFG